MQLLIRKLQRVSLVILCILLQFQLLYKLGLRSMIPSEGGQTLTILPLAPAMPMSSDFSEVFGDKFTTGKYDTSKEEASHKQDNLPPPKDMWLLHPPPFVPISISAFIPRIVNKVYFQKTSGYPSMESMSANLTMAHMSWSEMNPNYNIRYFDLSQAKQYLHAYFHPIFLRAFDCLQAFAAKADFFRMVLLYREGGWHSDWKEVCLQKNILEELSNVTDFFAAKVPPQNRCQSGNPQITNAFVGAAPQHPIIVKFLELTLKNIQQSQYGITSLDSGGSTCVFGQAIYESEKERNSTWFSTYSAEPGIGEWTFDWNGRPIVLHKCKGCGSTQDWGNLGNNYHKVWKERKYYCEDAASLLRADVF